MANATRFRTHDVAKQPNERARLKVMSGPDKGAIYVITGSPIGIGRGETCDVVLSDVKTSRLHADLSFDGKAWKVRDLGSANGIRHNGLEEKSATVSSGDTIALGETILEFMSADAGGNALAAAPKSVHAVRQEQMAMLSQQERIKAITSFGGLAKAVSPGAPSLPGGNDPQKTKKMIYFGLAALLGIMMLLPDNEKGKSKSKAKAKKDEEAARDLASYLPRAQSAEVSKTIQMFFKSGFREFREGNYLRAKSQFETVLQIDPSHSLAKIYLNNATRAIQDEVNIHLTEAKKDFHSGKINQAKGHYEAVLRLLFKDQANPLYTEAKEQLEKVKTILKDEG